MYEAAARLGVSQYLPQVIDLTREIFGGFSHVTFFEDPEYAGDDHVIFHVPAKMYEDEERDIRRSNSIRKKSGGDVWSRSSPCSPRVYLVFAELFHPQRKDSRC